MRKLLVLLLFLGIPYALSYQILLNFFEDSPNNNFNNYPIAFGLMILSFKHLRKTESFFETPRTLLMILGFLLGGAKVSFDLKLTDHIFWYGFWGYFSGVILSIISRLREFLIKNSG